MTNSLFFRFTILAMAAIALISCEKDDDNGGTPPGGNEEEVITDLVLTFTNTDDQSVLVFAFSDPDGPGGSTPIIEDIELEDSTSYTVSVEVLDASNPADVEDITEEITAEAEEHQFFYIAEGLNGSVAIAYVPADVDENGNPLGLTTAWSTAEPTTTAGAVRIVLRHELDKTAPGIAIDDFAGSGGETDIDVTFNLTVSE